MSPPMFNTTIFNFIAQKFWKSTHGGAKNKGDGSFEFPLSGNYTVQVT